jgi:hypothetical protein
LGRLPRFTLCRWCLASQRPKRKKSPADNNDKACQLPLQDFHKRKINFPERGYEGAGVFSDIVFYKEQPFKR